jgi:hypothetical protein
VQVRPLYSEGPRFAGKMPHLDLSPTPHLAAAADPDRHDSVVLVGCTEDHQIEHRSYLVAEEDHNLADFEDDMPLTVSVMVEMPENLVVVQAGKVVVCSFQKIFLSFSVAQFPYKYNKTNKAEVALLKLTQ